MKPLISIIIPTRNEDKNISNCLKSIKNQTFKNYEIIVVDNNSKDDTKKISKKFTRNVFNQVPERSAQRNFGARKARGEYLLFIDADMVLTKKVIELCTKKIKSDPTIKSIVIPERSIGDSFWAKCKTLEKSFYEGVDWIEGARFFDKEIFNKLGGYDESMISGEDWDLGQRAKSKYKIARIKSSIYHNEGNLSLMTLLRKKYYYAKNINNYLSKKRNRSFFDQQSNIFRRYSLFFSRPSKLFSNPVVGFGLLTMKALEFFVGGLGYLNRK